MPNQNGPSMPDPDEFDRELRNITSGKAEPAKFTELSAAERAKQAERARQADQATGSAPPRLGWRAARKARKLRRPVAEPGQASNGSAGAGRTIRRRPGPVGSPRSRGQSPGQGSRLRGRPAVRKAGVLAGFVLLLYVLHLLGFGPPWPSFDGSGGSGGARSTSPSVTPNASPTPRSGSPASTPAFSVSDPFAGSPADKFADGARGISLPSAHPLGDYTAAQVSGAYAMTKRLLEAANLNDQTLLGGPPFAFARLLMPEQASYFDQNVESTGVAPNGAAKSTHAWVTSFAPGSLVLVGSVIKVHGVMTATTARDGGRRVLRIHADYLFVYPVQQAAQPATRMRIMVSIVANADFAAWASAGGPLQVRWLPVSRGVSAEARCNAQDGFIYPNFAAATTGQAPPAGAPASQLVPPPAQAACGAVAQP